MRIQTFTDDRPYAVEIYRTGDALFIRTLPKTPKQLWRKTVCFAKILVPFLLLLPLVALTRKLGTGDEMLELVLGSLFFAVAPFVCVGLFLWLLQGEQSWIRIDRQGIHGTTWFFGKGTTRHMPRRLPLRLIYNVGSKAWHFETEKNRFGGNMGPVFLKARPHEIDWIAEQLRQFDAEVPGDPVPEKYKPPKNDSGRTILATLEFQGQTLHRIPDPVALHAEANAARETETSAGLLRIRCSHCNGIVPPENLWHDDALAQCPTCDTIFSVQELTVHPEPRRHRIRVTEDDEGLHLAQKTAWLNMASFCLGALFVLDLAMLALVFHLQEITPDLTIQDILFEKVHPRDGNGTGGAVGDIFRMLALAHLLCLPPLIWMGFGRRRIDFTRETVRFRVGLFFFESRWTVCRTDVGAFYTTLLGVTFFHGIRLPYQTASGWLRSIWLPATSAETPWLVARVYRWCMANPPHENAGNFSLETIPHDDPHARRWHEIDATPDDDRPRRMSLETSLSGVAEDDSARVHLFCAKCSAELSGKEVDLPNRQVRCRNCDAAFPLENIGCFVMQRERRVMKDDWRETPPLPGLFAQEFEDDEPELVVRYRPPRTSRKTRRLQTVGTAFGMVFFSAGALFILGAFPVMMLGKVLPVSSWLAGFFAFCFMSIFVLAFFPQAMLLFAMTLAIYDSHRSGRAAWMIRLSGRRLLVMRRYEKESETVEIERGRIVGVRLVDGSETFFQGISGRPIFGRFPSVLCSRGRISIELVLIDGTVEYLPQPIKEGQNPGDRARWLTNRLAEFLAKVPVVYDDNDLQGESNR